MGTQQLPYNLPPGYHTTPSGTYWVDPRGNYFWMDASGYAHPVQQQRQANWPFH